MVTRHQRERLDDDQTTTTPKRRIPRLRLDDKPAPRSTPDRLTLLDAIADPNLFLPSFDAPDDWAAWWAFVAAVFAYDMTPEQLALFEKCTGRKVPPSKQVKEAWLVVGRRGGKSRILALIAVWLGCFFNYRPYLAKGQRAVVQVMAADRDQTKEIMDYVKGFLAESKMLSRLVESSTARWVRLTNQISIEVTTASYKTSRGRTVVAVLADELAFWSSEDSSNPDVEVLAAARPSMLTIPNAMLLCASSPHARKGALWQAHKKHYGVESDRVLVWQADTLTMRPTAPDHIREEINQAYVDDPAQASANFGAQFRLDVEEFVSIEAVEAVTSDERERSYLSEFRYHAFVDCSGGSGTDSYTLGIGHVENGVSVLDALREVKPPFSPKAVTETYAKLLKDYRIAKVTGDRFAGEWPREEFRAFGIEYVPSTKTKSAIYSEFLALVNSKKCDLLDHAKMTTQLVGLERRASRQGRDSIDHGPGGHDDVINAAAGVIVHTGVRRYAYRADMSWVTGGIDADRQSGAAQQLSALLTRRGL